MPETRERRRKKRRYEDEVDDGPIGGWKLGIVIGVIVVCFTVIYPSVFHPLIMSFLGRSDTQPAPATTHRPPMHPGMAGRGAGAPHRGGGDVHPAMRMAAAQADQSSAKTSGGARGIYTWMIPFYTVGVVVFLLYSLFKSKKKKRKNRRLLHSSEEDEDDDEDEDIRERKGKFAGRSKLRGLQARLRQTEEAMNKILEQLEKAQSEGKINIEAVLGDANNKEEATPSDEKKKKKGSKSARAAAAIDTSSTNQVVVGQGAEYMEDLERALADFKQLSELYDEAKVAERRTEPSDSDSELISDEESASASGSSGEEENVQPFEEVEAEGQEDGEEEGEKGKEEVKQRVEESQHKKEEESEEEEREKKKEKGMREVPESSIPSAVQKEEVNKPRRRRARKI